MAHTSEMLPKVAVHMQVFVANPNKTQPIIDILAGNKDKLLRYLADFHSDKSAVPWEHVVLAVFSSAVL